MKLYAVLFLPERINQDNPTYDYEFNLTRIQPKVETYNTTYFKQQSKNKTTSLCRPLVFCGYDAYEGCKNITFSTCEHCR